MLRGGCPYDGNANCQVIELDGTHIHDVQIGTGCAQNAITGGTFTGIVVVNSGGEISGGIFSGEVQNRAGEISGGTFNAKVMNLLSAKITDGIFNGNVENYGTIEGGSYSAGQKVVNCSGGNITGGMFYGDVMNVGKLNGGEYYAKVSNFGNIHAGSFFGLVSNGITVDGSGTILNGSFENEVANKGTIQGGYFYEQVTNDTLGTITGGNYWCTIINNNSTQGAVHGVNYMFGRPADSSSGMSTHTHSYSWVTVKEVSMGEDGLEEYRCSCGDVAERVVVPASEYYVKQLYGDIRFADENGEVRFDAGSFHTISDYLLNILQSRQDVRLTLTFTYKGTSYEAVFTPNTDYTELLNDTEQFYGLLGLNGRYGVTVSEVA